MSLPKHQVTLANQKLECFPLELLTLQRPINIDLAGNFLSSLPSTIPNEVQPLHESIALDLSRNKFE